MDVIVGGRTQGNGDIDDFVEDHLTKLQMAWDQACFRLRKFNLASKVRQDKRRDTELSFRKGQRVLLLKLRSTQVDGGLPKAVEPFDGPFRIQEVLPRDNYRLMDMHTRRTREIIHVSRLEPYPECTNDGDLNLENDEFFVHRVIGRRIQESEAGEAHFEYRIRWRGYDQSEDSWKTIGELTNCLDLVRAYNQAHPVRSVREQRLCSEALELMPGFDDGDAPNPEGPEVRAFRTHPNIHSRYLEPDDAGAMGGYVPFESEEIEEYGEGCSESSEAEEDISPETLQQSRLEADEEGQLFFQKDHCEESKCIFPLGHTGGHSFEVSIDETPEEADRGPLEHRWDEVLGRRELKFKLWRPSGNSRQNGSFRFYVYNKTLSEAELYRCQLYAKQNKVKLPDLA